MNRRPMMFAAFLLLASALAWADVQPSGPVPSYEILTGCLERSAAGDFVLRCTADEVTLQQAGGMDKHLGRTVRVTGRWQDGTEGRRLRVAKIEFVADGCR